MTMITKSSYATTADLERELEILEQRLRDGERRIEAAQMAGADVEAWEEFWIELLHSYENVYDRLLGMDSAHQQIAA